MIIKHFLTSILLFLLLPGCDNVDTSLVELQEFMTNTRNSANLAISSPKPVEVSEIHSAYQAASVRDPFGSLMQQQSVLISNRLTSHFRKHGKALQLALSAEVNNIGC